MIIGIIETFRVVIGRVGREFHRYTLKSFTDVWQIKADAFVGSAYNIGCLWQSSCP